MVLRISAASIRYRKEFNSANKHGDETLENWYDRLKVLAESCDYGTYLEAFILNQFICGLDALILEYLNAEQKDLSLDDVFELTKSFVHSNELVDVKPVLVNIKLEELQGSDDEHFNDNAYSDSDDDEQGTTNEVNDMRPNGAQSEEDPRKDSIQAMVPFMAETTIESPEVPRLFECYLCHKTWKTAGNLTYHFTCYHTTGKTSKCNLCGKWIKDASNMVRHLNSHFKTKQFRCSMCDSEFARYTSLKKHLQSHSEPNAKEFKCSKCSKVFITRMHFKAHLKEHKRPEVSLSQSLDNLIKKKKAKAKSAAQGSHQCHICSTSFVKETELNVHMKVHTETEWLCHLCGKKLMNKRNLIHHYRVHSDEKPFACDECGRTFASKEKWKLHAKGHSGIRPHSCTHCDKSFIQKGHLVKHMKVHFPDERRFKCDQCSKDFSKEERLERHLLKHAGLRPVGCNYCEKRFRSNNHRIEHERTHTGEKPYRCPICDKCFGQRATLRGHVKIHSKPPKPKSDRPKKRRKPKVDNPIGYSIVEATAAYLG
ncbi:hypothetical protein HA402_009805 [Bradysia odoriphaga]|nr:hypothetical protein HA402_009805 [Bradysia odoriphaga]